MEIDWEASLVELLGDVAGHQIAEGLRRFFRWGEGARASLKRQVSEYLLEEGRLTRRRQNLSTSMTRCSLWPCGSNAPRARSRSFWQKPPPARHHNESRGCAYLPSRATDSISCSPRISVPDCSRYCCACSPCSGPRHNAAGERLRQALEDLGPVFVKFGQLLSTRRDLLLSTSPMNWPCFRIRWRPSSKRGDSADRGRAGQTAE